MPTMNLTDRIVMSAAVKAGNRLELWEATTPGLCPRVTKTGVKTWIFRYRTPNGKQPRYTIGQVPAFGLKDARVRATEIDRQVANGGDPAMDRRDARLEVEEIPTSFDGLATAYFTACETGEWKPRGKRKKPAVLTGEKSRYALHIKPELGDRTVTDIRRKDVKALLRAMIAKGIQTQTNLTQALIRQIFNYAISEWVDEEGDEVVQINPATGFARLGDQAPRSQIWSDKDLRLLWAALDDPSDLADGEGRPIHIGPGMCIAIKLLALLGQRRAEVIGMERGELDLEAKTWIIRAERMKGSRFHLVPLSDEAVDLIRQAIVVADRDREEPSAYVFPTSRKGG